MLSNKLLLTASNFNKTYAMKRKYLSFLDIEWVSFMFLKMLLRRAFIILKNLFIQNILTS